MGGSSLRAVSQRARVYRHRVARKTEKWGSQRRRLLLALLDVLGEPLKALEQTLAGRRTTNTGLVGADNTTDMDVPRVHIPRTVAHPM